METGKLYTQFSIAITRFRDENFKDNYGFLFAPTEKIKDELMNLKLTLNNNYNTLLVQHNVKGNIIPTIQNAVDKLNSGKSINLTNLFD